MFFRVDAGAGKINLFGSRASPIQLIAILVSANLSRDGSQNMDVHHLWVDL
jgi:hypothetical protein